MKFEAPIFDESQNPNISHDTSHWKELRAMLGYLIATIIVIGLLIEAVIWSLPHTISLQRERAWFGFVGTTLLEDEHTHRDESLQKLADQLAVHLELPEHSVDVYISDEDIPNAFATFGGNVVLYRGLLNRLPNEESVATVLAHEMGHIKHRDPLRGISRSILYSVVAALFGSETQMQAIAHLENLRYSRDMENAADSEAIDAIVKQYHSVAGAMDLFTVFQKLEREHQADGRPTWLSTHPDTAQRIQHVQETASRLQIENTPAQLPNRWQQP